MAAQPQPVPKPKLRVRIGRAFLAIPFLRRFYLKRLLALLVERVDRPESLDPRAFERTLRARAFDVSRGLLPLATITSLGQVVSARVLERQISRLSGLAVDR